MPRDIDRPVFTEQHRAIVAMHKDGKSVRVIAKKYDVSTQAVYQHLQRANRKGKQ